MNDSSNNSLATSKTTRKGLKLFFCVFLIFSAFFLVFKRTDWFPWVGECYANDKPGYFLAYCHSIRYGDYEHYAYYHESEPTAVANAKAAQVVFLGSSNTQFAFSTNAVVDFFARLPVTHYVLGFGQGSQSGVAEAMIEKLELAPDVWVINADPFFTGEVNGTFARIDEPFKTSNGFKFLPLWLRPGIHGEHARKRLLQTKQKDRCIGSASDEPGTDRYWCQGQADTLHRNPENGHWFVENYRDNLEIPVENTSSHMDKLADYTTIAEQFIENAGIDKQCLVITATPRTDTPKEYAEALAASIGAGFVFPQLENLKTIDGFHLDADSSERWSAALLQELSSYIERCSTN